MYVDFHASCNFIPSRAQFSYVPRHVEAFNQTTIIFFYENNLPSRLETFHAFFSLLSSFFTLTQFMHNHEIFFSFAFSIFFFLSLLSSWSIMSWEIICATVFTVTPAAATISRHFFIFIFVISIKRNLNKVLDEEGNYACLMMKLPHETTFNEAIKTSFILSIFSFIYSSRFFSLLFSYYWGIYFTYAG